MERIFDSAEGSLHLVKPAKFREISKPTVKNALMGQRDAISEFTCASR